MKIGNETVLSSRKSSLAIVFSITYGLALFYIVFDARRRRSLHEKFNVKMLNLRPLWGKAVDFSKFLRLNQRDQIVNFFTDVCGNILMFMPLPVCIFLMLGSIKLRTAILFGLTISILIEVVQFVFGLGVADIDDVLLNTLGTVVGYEIIRFVFGRSETKFRKYIFRK